MTQSHTGQLVIVNARVSRSLANELKRKAKSEDRTVSSVLRRLISLYVDPEPSTDVQRDKPKGNRRVAAAGR